MSTSNQLVPSEIKELALKVWTPIMSFVYFFYILIATVIFIARGVSETFAFDIVISVWIGVALLFSLVIGLIFYQQSQSIIKGKTRRKKKNTTHEATAKS